MFAISLTVSGLDPMIEPVQNNRLRNARSAYEAGAKIILYLRPLVEAWGSTPDRIHNILIKAYQELGPDGLAAIAPGGLRWTSGIEYGLQVRGIPWPENLSKNENEKDMPDALWDFILKESGNLFPNTPIVKHSSCALSTLLGVPDQSLVHTRKTDECLQSHCSAIQRSMCLKAHELLSSTSVISTTQTQIDAKGIPVQLIDISESGQIECDPPWNTLKYSIQRNLIRLLAQSIDEENV